jgi:hypothetical protein
MQLEKLPWCPAASLLAKPVTGKGNLGAEEILQFSATIERSHGCGMSCLLLIRGVSGWSAVGCWSDDDGSAIYIAEPQYCMTR